MVARRATGTCCPPEVIVTVRGGVKKRDDLVLGGTAESGCRFRRSFKVQSPHDRLDLRTVVAAPPGGGVDFARGSADAQDREVGEIVVREAEVRGSFRWPGPSQGSAAFPNLKDGPYIAGLALVHEGGSRLRGAAGTLQGIQLRGLSAMRQEEVVRARLTPAVNVT